MNNRTLSAVGRLPDRFFATAGGERGSILLLFSFLLLFLLHLLILLLFLLSFLFLLLGLFRLFFQPFGCFSAVMISDFHNIT